MSPHDNTQLNRIGTLRCTVFGAIWWICISEEKANCGREDVVVGHWILLKGPAMSEYGQGTSIEIDLDFHQLRGKTR